MPMPAHIASKPGINTNDTMGQSFPKSMTPVKLPKEAQNMMGTAGGIGIAKAKGGCDSGVEVLSRQRSPYPGQGRGSKDGDTQYN